MNNKTQATIQSILVVEDEPAIRMMIETMLEDLPVAVTLVATADEGFHALHSQIWRLIITDVQTPGRSNGIELASAALAHQPEIQVIVMSGYHNAMGLPLPEGASFLSKPWSLKEFYELVEFHLST
ncbi:response regulator [Pseudomonas fulva]|uniref:response regulator n=1 Tax=Pseudomonas fulva TaxID=47880 RepID=UPI001F32CC4A|nr:response regulator [Pseudomonas fulva]